jgi:hypothetical protein
MKKILWTMHGGVNSSQEVHQNEVMWKFIIGNSFGKFGTGNNSTLNKPDIREVLLKFYSIQYIWCLDTYYSANIMRLCVTSNMSID